MRSPNLVILIVLACAIAFATAPRARALPAPAGSVAAAPSTSASASAIPTATSSGPSSRALLPAMDATNSCVTCHAGLSDTKLRVPAKDFLGSVHRDERIGCVGCHGGDPRDSTVGAHAIALGFTPHPAHSEIAGMCGSCHSDASFMRRLNARISIGQEAMFRLSLHGKLSESGDDRAPNCAVCHGKHDILPPSSPRSPVNRLNVAKLCSSCHSDPERMVRYNLRTDQFSKWEKSVHGEAFKSGNPNAPTCTGCHGAHSAAPPDASSVARACGRCHEVEMGFFEQSPHSKGFRSRGLAECVACHSNHDVARATALLVGTTPDATCMKCHGKDDKPRRVADEISGLLSDARTRAAEARSIVARAKEEGFHVAGVGPALERLAMAEQRLRASVHTLDPLRLKDPIETIHQSVDEAERLVSGARQVREHKRRGYYVELGLSGVLFGLLALKAVQLDRRRRGRP